MEPKYFYFSASFQVGLRHSNGAFGATFDRFPTRDDLHNLIKSSEPGAHNIVVLSICEMTKENLIGLMPPNVN